MWMVLPVVVAAAPVVPAPPANAALVTVGGGANIIGVVDEEVAAQEAAFRAALAQCGASLTPLSVPVAGCDGACLQADAQKTGQKNAIVVEVLRVGNDVEVSELALIGGTLSPSKRQGRADAMASLWVAPSTCTALLAQAQALAPVEETAPPSSPSQPSPSSPALHPGFIVAGVGAGALALGLAGFAVDASTLEDPASAGADKARAAATGWVWLGVAGAGVAAAAAGAGWALAD